MANTFVHVRRKIRVSDLHQRIPHIKQFTSLHIQLRRSLCGTKSSRRLEGHCVLELHWDGHCRGQLGESVVSSCNLQIANVNDGSTLPTCVPSAKITTTTAPKVAADSITESQAYNVSVNDPKYVSAGVGRSSDNAWYVLVLATNSSGGNYINQNLDPSGASMLSACLMFTTITAYMVLSMILG
jgi:hypothetical protein